MGLKWFQHPETKVSDHVTQFTDVRQFIQESSLTLEVDAEMEGVADTFRGVENLHYGVFHWEGSSGNQQAKNEQKRHKQAENFANDHSFRANLLLGQDARPGRMNIRSAGNWVKLGESQRTRLWSYLWKILPQQTTSSSKHSIELIEFAGDLGNSNSTLQTQ